MQRNRILHGIISDNGVDGGVGAAGKGDGELLEGLAPGGEVAFEGQGEMVGGLPGEAAVEGLGEMVLDGGVVVEGGIGSDA